MHRTVGHLLDCRDGYLGKGARMRHLTVLSVSALLVLLTASVVDAQPTPEVTAIRIGYLRVYEPQLALSVLDVPPRDEGVAGANVAIADNNTTGKFMGQE